MQEDSKCPRCRGEVDLEAVICPHCRSRLVTPWWRTVESAIFGGVVVVALIVGGVMWKNKLDTDARNADYKCELSNAFARELGGPTEKC